MASTDSASPRGFPTERSLEVPEPERSAASGTALPLVSLRALLVGPDPRQDRTLELLLKSSGATVRAAPSLDSARTEVVRESTDLIFVDCGRANRSALQFISELVGGGVRVPVVAVVGEPSGDTVREALGRGAADYLEEPIQQPRLEALLRRISALRSLECRLGELDAWVRETAPWPEVGLHPLNDQVLRTATGNDPVLIHGEKGLGKLRLARLIHSMSPRKHGPLVTVHCSASPEDDVARELLGLWRGVGAARSRRGGAVDRAYGGTVLLREVGGLSLPLQDSFLQILSERRFPRAHPEARNPDVRFIALSELDLSKEVQAGRFREDLLFFLNVCEITIPPLRQRPEEILPMARQILAALSRFLGIPPVTLSRATEELLVAYPWPRNVIELRNVLEGAVLFWPSSVLEPAAFPQRLFGTAPGESESRWECSLRDLEREHIRRVLERASNLREAARILGIDEATLWRKRKRFGLDSHQESTPQIG